MKLVKILFALAALAIIVAIGVFYWAFNNLSQPVEHAKSNQYIVIERGSSPGQIIDKLAAEGIVANPWLLRIYARTLGDTSKMQAGEYKFESPITPLQVLAELEQGQERTTRLVIPEGFTMFDIVGRMREFKQTNSPSKIPGTTTTIDPFETRQLMDDISLIKDLSPEAKNLEGYMYPSTYDIPPDSSVAEMIKHMVEKFRRVWKPDWTAKAKAIGRTPHEIVTIASLIETETGVPAERPIVASVIYNRLSKNIPLGIDMTNIYIAKMQGRWDGTIHKSDLEVASPYNTRKYPGIPPGPISSVSESSIEAALNPATTDYIFYVRNVQLNDGSHHFYASAADFERGKAEYQRWLEEERRLKRESEANN
jgi:conserved hypothetical protein, YceG family